MHALSLSAENDKWAAERADSLKELKPLDTLKEKADFHAGNAKNSFGLLRYIYDRRVYRSYLTSTFLFQHHRGRTSFIQIIFLRRFITPHLNAV